VRQAFGGLETNQRGAMMGKTTETIEHRTSDLCGQEIDKEELVTLHRSGDRMRQPGWR
jgi:hypothetical protein